MRRMGCCERGHFRPCGRTYAGPLPEIAVAMSRYFSSSTITSSPKAPSTLATSRLSLSLSSGVPIHTVMPSLTAAGVLGIERTVQMKRNDGTDSHVTYKIVTDRKEVWIVCCNMGQCFTQGQEEPSPGKESEATKPAEDETSKPVEDMTEEEQMEAYEESLKDTDWGHQPC